MSGRKPTLAEWLMLFSARNFLAFIIRILRMLKRLERRMDENQNL